MRPYTVTVGGAEDRHVLAIAIEDDRVVGSRAR